MHPPFPGVSLFFFFFFLLFSRLFSQTLADSFVSFPSVPRAGRFESFSIIFAVRAFSERVCRCVSSVARAASPRSFERFRERGEREVRRYLHGSGRLEKDSSPPEDLENGRERERKREREPVCTNRIPCLSKKRARHSLSTRSRCFFKVESPRDDGSLRAVIVANGEVASFWRRRARSNNRTCDSSLFLKLKKKKGGGEIIIRALALISDCKRNAIVSL